MTEREFKYYTAHSGAAKEGARFTAYIAVRQNSGKGFPVFYAVYENRSFRTLDAAQEAGELALSKMLGVEDDGTPFFDEEESGFDDE
jgi:hypothetical protein